MEENKLTNNFDDNYICSRCKIKPAEFSCAICDPFKYLCYICNENFHSQNSNKFHIIRKIKIEKKTIDYSDDFNNKTNLESKNNRFYTNEDELCISESRYNSNKDNFNTYSPNQEKYLNNLKKFDKETLEKSYTNEYIDQSIKNKMDNNRNFTIDSERRMFYNFKRTDRKENSNSRSPRNKKIDNFPLEKERDYSNGKNNYINDIRRVYDKEREDLQNKNYINEKKLDELKLEAGKEILDLKFRLEDLIKNYEYEIQQIKEENEIFVKKIKNEKDQEIKDLTFKNKDLEKLNQELLKKNNEYTLSLQQIKYGLTDKISEFDLENKQKDKEIYDLKTYYEDRISYITNNYNNEKIRLLSENEKNIEKVQKGYEESKEKLLDIINKKNFDINDIEENHNYELEKLHRIIDSLKKQIKDLNYQISDSSQIIQQLSLDNKLAIESIDKLKIEKECLKMETKKLEDQNDDITRNYEILKLNHQKLERITKGKLTKKHDNKNDTTLISKNSSNFK